MFFFRKESFRNAIRVESSLDPDQAHHFDGPDLVSNFMQRLSVEDTSRYYSAVLSLYHHIVYSVPVSC